MRGAIDLRLTYTVFADGERYPVLLNKVGCPEWYPTLFVTIAYRNKSKAFGTAHAALAAVRQVLIWAQSERVDLIARFKHRQFLATHEIDGLADFLRRRREENLANGPVSLVRASHKERSRAVAPSRSAVISAGFAYSRLSYAAHYLSWLATRITEEGSIYLDADTSARIENMSRQLRARRPAGARKSRLGTRKAQTLKEADALLELARPEHENNPFSDTTARRNLLIVMMLNELGLRQGELLAIKVPDIDFQAQEIVIPRRHNDPEDPRQNQPVAKTLDRRLALSDELTLVLSEYVLKDRYSCKPARRHPFLLVATRGSRAGEEGAPISRQGLTKIISSLSGRMPPGSARVHPHILRHNAATRMFQQLREQGVSEPRMEQLLSWKFGWADGSGTARTYIERELERQALQVQRNLQKKWNLSRNDDPTIADTE